MKMFRQLSKNVSLLVVFMMTISFSMAQTLLKQNTDIFPAPEKGYKKLVIEVPHSTQDDNKKIEFTVGKWMDVDGCNYYNLMGTLENKDLAGWGYNYYVFKTDGQVTSTMIGCPDAKSRNIFLSAQPEFVRYNGKLPIVVYVPEEYEVQFRIFKAEPDVYIAAEDKSSNKK